MAELDINEHKDKSIPDLIDLMSSMQAPSGSVAGAQVEAYRQAIQCLIDEKLTYSLINAINKLDESTTRLTKVGYWLTGIGIFIGIIGTIASILSLQR